MQVGMVQTGVANVASIRAAFGRLQCELVSVCSPHDVNSMDAIVVPGVGSFGAGMKALQEQGLVEPLRDRITAGDPTLAICLGLQLLSRDSEETPGVRGLGCIDGSVRRFTSVPVVPQFGWSLIEAGDGCTLLESGYVYFANSYKLSSKDERFQYATAAYGGTYCAGFERDGVLACQFHPELSGQLGHRIIKRWLKKGGFSC